MLDFPDDVFSRLIAEPEVLVLMSSGSKVFFISFLSWESFSKTFLLSRGLALPKLTSFYRKLRLGAYIIGNY